MARGHRTVPHTADVVLESWGPDLAACLEEAVAALVSTYVEGHAPVVTREAVTIPAAPDDALLLAVLEEVVFALDTAEGIPVAAEVRTRDDGGVDLTLLLAAPPTVQGTGAVPKAVSRSGLAVERADDRVRARFLVDL